MSAKWGLAKTGWVVGLGGEKKKGTRGYKQVISENKNKRGGEEIERKTSGGA